MNSAAQTSRLFSSRSSLVVVAQRSTAASSGYAAEKKAFNAHPLNEAVDPACGECEGTGKVETTYNKKSQWDWYSIGGRWNGTLRGIDPADDEGNWQECWLCHGVGKRADMEVANGCNGCSGKGISLKYPSDQKDAGNVMPVSEFLHRLDKHNAPFAVLTPAGEWIERGQMGWWGFVDGEKKKGDWMAELATIYARFPEADIVLVDCHI